MKQSENTGPPQSTENSRIIAKNAVWSGVEVGFGLIANLFTSIAIARILGRDELGKALSLIHISRLGKTQCAIPSHDR